jgi:hypothetical protein
MGIPAMPWHGANLGIATEAYIALAGKYFRIADTSAVVSGNPQAAATMGRGPSNALNAEQVIEMHKKRADENFERFANTFKKIHPSRQVDTLARLTDSANSPEGLRMLEELLDEVMATVPRPPMPALGAPIPATRMVDERVVPPATAPVGLYAPPTVLHEVEFVDDDIRPLSAERIIEECDRPWAMTSDSLYGMFPADWGKEAEAIPDFIVNSTSDDLAKKLARSVGEDAEAKDFVAACRSILSLTNKPMSSPWFETSGGRLRSEIQYSLSQKGQMFTRFLRTVKDSSGSEKARELSKVAERTLEKIEMVLAK